MDYRTEVYSEWQEYMVEEIPVFPTTYRAELVPINNRVQNWSIQSGSKIRSDIELTQEEPVLPGE